MKITLRFTLILMLIISLNSCATESCYDINETIKRINTNSNLNLRYEDFKITKHEEYIYSTNINNTTLLRLYCNTKNEIIKCTVTSKTETQKNYKEICNIIKKVLNNETEAEPWMSAEIDSDIGKTFIIYKSKYTLSSNKELELKETVEEDKITRPKNYHSTIQDIIS